jgi:uncharacterized protein (TIGR03083 family)
MDLLPAIAEERLRLADILGRLTPEQWTHESLCQGWTNRHVAAHVSMGFNLSIPKVGLAMLKARGDFHKVTNTYAHREAVKPTSELVDCIRRNANHKFKPPGNGYDAPLTDVMIHILDICRPLGVDPGANPTHWPTVLDFLVTKKATKFFKTDLDGLRFDATDIDWSAGTGPAVSGPAADIALVLAKRRIDTSRLTGDGVTLIKS